MSIDKDIHKVLKRGKLLNELELERAITWDRELRILSKEDSSFIELRSQIRDLIEAYETIHWSGDSISEKQISSSDLAEDIIEQEQLFFRNRRDLIRSCLKKFGLSQQDLGMILGHDSKSYMSELMNGLSPFTMKDLVVIHRLLNLPLDKLIPTMLGQNERKRIKSSLESLNNPKLKLGKSDLELA